MTSPWPQALSAVASSERCSVRTQRAAALRRPAHGELEEGIGAQRVAVASIFISARDREHAEALHRRQRVHHPFRIAPVIASLDPEEVEAALQRYTTPRLQLARAIAIDGKRIRGANRNGDGHFETATLVEHATRMPVATLNYHDDGGEIAAVRTLLEQVPVEGRVITLDALHTTRDTARAIVETHRADYLMSVKDNAPETRKALETVDWERAASGRFEEKIEKAHGRIEQRRIEVLTPLPRLINYPHVAQMFRVTRERTDARRNGTGETSIEHAYGITSAPAERASPEQLLAWNRGHWSVEVNHHIRDQTFAEDACLARAGFAPANNSTCTNLALAITIHKTPFESFATATRHFALQRRDALTALLLP